MVLATLSIRRNIAMFLHHPKIEIVDIQLNSPCGSGRAGPGDVDYASYYQVKVDCILSSAIIDEL